ncbi:MAG: DUF58 domain-containing protein [Brevefilum sp.]|nr:DUF58 domain-containing protein [Brevefilum sp.]
MTDYLPLIVFLMILAVLLRAESALTVLYMIVGTFLIGFWWNKRAIRHIEFKREFDDHVFLGEKIDVDLTIKNQSLLPILWLEIHESTQPNLSAGKSINEVFSLGIYGEKNITYALTALKRGYYKLGPLTARTGDPLGLVKPSQVVFHDDPIIIYPQIIDLSSFTLPSRSPFGTIKHKNPIFEDPSRLLGKRDFSVGDSVRRIDWKATASTGKLQVKLYEASIALDVLVMLDLHRESYEIKSLFDASELAITAAASIAAWGNNKQQSVGLITNGTDPLMDNRTPAPLLPHKGSGHFINILEILARIQLGDEPSIENLLRENSTNLSWGTTIILLSGGLKQNILERLYKLRKRGLMPVVILTANTPNYPKLRSLSEFFSIPLYTASKTEHLKTLGMG